MNNFWICIEPSVFIWKDDKRVLFYNSNNYEKLLQERHDSIKTIVDNLIDPANFYSALFSDADMMNAEFNEFLNNIVKIKMGAILPFEGNDNKPVTIPPYYIFPRDFNLLKKREIDYFDPHMLRNLKDITIQITGKCSLSCPSCSYFYRQKCHCSRSENELSMDAIKTIVRKIKLTGIQKVDIIGGDIFRHGDFCDVMNVLDDITQTKIYHSNFKFINKETAKLLLRNGANALLKILVEPLDIWLDELHLLFDELHSFEHELIWAFSLTSEATLKNFETLVDKYKISNYEYHVLYNGKNMDFLLERRFLSEEDIWQLKLGLKDIFANQMLNKNFFSKLFIHADGQIYEDQNTISIGTIHDNLENILYSLMNNEGAWFRTRLRNNVCRNCVYRFLCPPPSDLENLLQRNTICNKY